MRINRTWMKYVRFALCAIVIVSMFAVSAFAVELKVGTIKADRLNMRSAPSLSAKLVGQAADGDQVVILSKQGNWYKVVFNGVQGYMHADYVTISETGDFSIGTGSVRGTSVNFRKRPSTNADVIKKLDRGEKVNVIGVERGWYKISVNDEVGYIHPDYLEVIKAQPLSRGKVDEAPPADAGVAEPLADVEKNAEQPSEPTTLPNAPETIKEEAENSDSEAMRVSVVAYAEKFLGCKYRYGTMNGKTFDCSGFTSYVFNEFDISLNRSAAGQVSNGTKVSREDLKPGDLVLFRDPSINRAAASHVGLYVGDSKFIHCSSRGGGVKYNSLNDNYYNKYYIGGRRVIES